MRRVTLRFCLIVTFSLIFNIPGLAQAKDAKGSAAAGEILWDKWGVPHIYAHNEASAFRAYGWAQMHNDGDLLLHLYARARGRAAEYFGEAQLPSDRMVRTMGIYQLASKWYQEQDPAFRRDLDAFASGINEYAREHPDTLEPAVRAVLPVNPVDVVAHTSLVLHDFQVGICGLGPLGGGSNGWAIARSHSASGNAMLLANPHLPWSGEMLWFEAQIVTGDYSAYGASLIGLPVLTIAFNENLGWTHTVNVIDTCDQYEITPQGNGYRFDGQEKPFETWTETLKVLQKDGSLAEQTLSIRSTVQGPVLEKDGKLFAYRVSGFEAGSISGALRQWWEMGKAKNLEQFQAALRRMQLPMFNTIFADASGNAFELYGGLVPKRSKGDFSFWYKSVPGDTSETLWNSVLAYDALPQALNPASGWVQNSNSPPWYMAQPLLDSAKYPAYLSPSPAQLAGSPNFREQRGIRMLTETSKLSYEQLVADKYSARSELADRIMDDLLKAAEARGSEAAKKAAAVLRDWDRCFNPQSKGAVLFYGWAQALNKGKDPAGPFAVPFDPKELLTTPRGLKDPAVAAEALEHAAAQVEKQYGSLDVPWGQVARLTRGKFDVPANGAPGSLGVFRVLYFDPDKSGKYLSTMGDSYIAAVEFSHPLKAQVLLTYGNSSNPGSPHYGDQIPLSGEGKLRNALLTRAQVEAQKEERTSFPRSVPENRQ